jgi:hypothetical protein
MAEYTETATKLGRDSGKTSTTIRKYADEGWLDYIVASNGTRLFKPGQAAKVKEIYAARMAVRYKTKSKRVAASPAAA